MIRLVVRLRRRFMRRTALLDALEDAYMECTRYRRLADNRSDEIYLLKLRLGVDNDVSTVRNIP